jgi:hypothetical protein
MTTITNSPVAIGDKIIPLPTNDGDWYGIDECYREKHGVVTHIYDDSVLAEFTSYSKPDDSVSLLVCRWRKRPTVGDTVRVIDESWSETYGKIGHIEQDDESILPFWVKGLYENTPNRGIWATVTQVEVVQDGQTLTVSGPFRAGETLIITGRDDHWAGREVTYVKPEFGSRTRHEVTCNGDTLYFSETQLMRPDVAEEPEIVKELRFQLERANERVTEATTTAGKWERDFHRSWERVGREATERSWCDEYERVVSDVQDDLEIGVIPARVRLVEKRVRIRGEVYRDVTVWVPEDQNADDPDNWYESNDPDDKCSEEFMTDQIDREYSNNGWDETSVSVLR